MMGGGMDTFSDFGEMIAVKEKMNKDWEEHGSVYAMEQMDMAVMYRSFLASLPEMWCVLMQIQDSSIENQDSSLEK